jgi:hypothetical protein
VGAADKPSGINGAAGRGKVRIVERSSDLLTRIAAGAELSGVEKTWRIRRRGRRGVVIHGVLPFLSI